MSSVASSVTLTADICKNGLFLQYNVRLFNVTTNVVSYHLELLFILIKIKSRVICAYFITIVLGHTEKGKYKWNKLPPMTSWVQLLYITFCPHFPRQYRLLCHQEYVYAALEHCPIDWKVAGSIPSQDTYVGCGHETSVCQKTPCWLNRRASRYTLLRTTACVCPFTYIKPSPEDIFSVLVFREEGNGRGRERSMWERNIDQRLPYAPRSGIEPTTFWCMGQSFPRIWQLLLLPVLAKWEATFCTYLPNKYNALFIFLWV